MRRFGPIVKTGSRFDQCNRNNRHERVMRLGFGIVLAVFFHTVAFAQSYPIKPVRIVTARPGGSSDFVARLIAKGLSDSFDQQAIVDNRVAIVAVETVANAPADGYTLLVMSNLLWTFPLLQTANYDAVKDFAPISLAASSPNILVVHPSMPVTSIKELIDLAKLKPGEINFGTSGTGASNHLAAELFKAMTGINIVRVNYKGGGPMLRAILSGEVQMAFASASSVAPHLKAGRLRALGVTSARPSPLLPGLPPIADTVPGYEATAMYGVFAPAGTPAGIINRVNEAISKFLSTPDARKIFLRRGAEPIGDSPSDFGAAMRADLRKMSRVIKQAHLGTK